ncbi:MAG: D-sedoheptulose 7-phosphate isomerase, partial [Deltaproteobacteria bacterium]|nr:D-sedoheptulose 7-phosphate isomerase [Deltaproteobacteria bacterium]
AREGAKAREEFFRDHAGLVIEAAQMISICLARKGKLLLCGNGGSAADAQHVAAEFVNRFLLERPPLPAIALSTDSSILTSIGNDYSFEQIFSKQVLALGQPGDVLLAISTSGGSPNVLEAIRAARERGLKVIGLTGKDGGKMAGLCDILLNVQHQSTPAIQEVHLAVEHLICRLCDYYLFENVRELMPLLEE